MGTITNEYVDLLRKELSLVDDVEFNRKQAQKEEAKLKKIQRFIEKDLNAIELDWNDLYIIDELEIKKILPKTFFDVFGNNRDIIIRKSLYSLRLSNPELIDTFLRHLSQDEIKYEKRNNSETRHYEPLDYLFAHQYELGATNYYMLFGQLCGNKDFIIDKKRLSAKQYCNVMGLRNIHLDDSEADNLLFGHILKFLHFDYKPPRYAIDNYMFTDGIRAAYDIKDIYKKYRVYQSLFHWYTPSLVYLPDMAFYIHTMIGTGNNRTVAKFIAWDKYIRRYIPKFSALKEESYIIKGLKDQKKLTFSEYLDWSWERLMENAIENFPFKREDIIYEFGLPDNTR